METTMMIATVLELGAAGILAWLLWSGARKREVALGEQRAALESLRADLAELVAEAERRATTLGVPSTSRDARRVAPAHAPEPTRPAPGAPSTPVDPAEARLLRDLEMSFARPEAR